MFWVLEQLVAVGEWCMEHRWASLALIMALVAAFAAVFSNYLTVHAQTQNLRRDYESWFLSAERLLLESSLTHPETSRFRQAEAYWHKDFNLLFPKTHPANCLHDLYQLLFTDIPEQSWAKTIRRNEKEIDRLGDQCRVTGVPSDLFHAKQAQALIDIARVKLLVRLARFDKDTDLLVAAFHKFDVLNSS